MDLEKIFRLIRKEEVVLWVGSGFSHYAGYKMGKTLSQRLYDELTAEQRKTVSPTLSLPDMAEQFVRCCIGKNELFQILKEEYEKEPTTIKYHSLLSQLPHFKTIVTTNYDPLFKLAYKNYCQIIFNDTHLATLSKKTEIIEAHGDLSDVKSVIITREDYENYFLNQKNNPLLWNLIQERITSKAVLFIGYDLEDPNVNVMLHKIKAALGEWKREIFFVAPNLVPQKIDNLIQKGIKYIDLTGEQFVTELHKDIRKNIKKDFEKKWITTETFQKFADALDLNARVSFKEGNHFAMLSPKAGTTAEGLFNLSFSCDQTESQQRFKDFVSGKNLEQFVFDKSNVKNFEFLMSGISIADSTEDNVSFVLQRQPAMEGEIKVVFDDGSEYDRLEFVAHRIKDNIKIILTLKQATLTFSIPAKSKVTTFNGTFLINDSFRSVNDALFSYEFFSKLNSGLALTIYFYRDNEVGKGVPLKLTKSPSEPKKVKEILGYLKDLKLIEKHYRVYFQKISEDEMNFEITKHLKNIIKHNMTSRSFNDVKLVNTTSTFNWEEFDTRIKDGFFIVMEGDWEELPIHDQKIKLGYPVYYYRNPFYSYDASKCILSIGSKKPQISYYAKRLVPNRICLVKQGDNKGALVPELVQSLQQHSLEH